MSMEYLNSDDKPDINLSPQGSSAEICPTCRAKITQDELPCKECFKVTTVKLQEVRNHNSHLRIPCENGQTYSVSQNRIVYLPGSTNDESDFVPYVKNRVIEFESHSGGPIFDALSLNKKTQSDRKGLVLNLTSQFETSCSKSGSPTDGEKSAETSDVKSKYSQIVNSTLVKEEIWDSGEKKPEESPNSQTVWTSTSEPTTDGDIELPLSENKAGKTRREGDPFSDKLDRVFDREERKQIKTTVPAVVSVVPVAVPVTNSEGGSTESPSRQNSWSSYDSAVVLGFQGEPREAPSRQSSWGSGDISGVPGALPSRNSSWGSYDMKPTVINVSEKVDKTEELNFGGLFTFNKDVPWNPGTVKRTKQKLEEVIQVKENGATTEVESASSSFPSSSSPPKIEISVCNLKLHGPKPYQSPVLSKDLKISSQDPSESPSLNLVHYQSTPSLSLQPSLENTSVSVDKMTASQPNITFQQDTLNTLSKSTDQLSLTPASATDDCLDHKQSEGQTTTGLNQSCSVRQQKQVLENLTNKCCVLPKRCISMEESVIGTEVSKPDAEAQKSVSGLVQNLKKEFEAKSVYKNNDKTSSDSENLKQSSPVGNNHQDPCLVVNSSEDLSVKNLVGKYEIKKNKHRENESMSNKKSHNMIFPSRKPKLDMVSQPQLKVKHSSLFLHNFKNSTTGEKVLVLDRPPAKSPSPSVVVASVVAKAASKKQQGKTHPLAHLTINPRHSNAVYNTM